MRISAQDLANVLKRLPEPNVYQRPLVNIAVQGHTRTYTVPDYGRRHEDLRVVTFRKRTIAPGFSRPYWELELI